MSIHKTVRKKKSYYEKIIYPPRCRVVESIFCKTEINSSNSSDYRNFEFFSCLILSDKMFFKGFLKKYVSHISITAASTCDMFNATYPSKTKNAFKPQITLKGLLNNNRAHLGLASSSLGF